MWESLPTAFGEKLGFSPCVTVGGIVCPLSSFMGRNLAQGDGGGGRQCSTSSSPSRSSTSSIPSPPHSLQNGLKDFYVQHQDGWNCWRIPGKCELASWAFVEMGSTAHLFPRVRFVDSLLGQPLLVLFFEEMIFWVPEMQLKESSSLENLITFSPLFWPWGVLILLLLTFVRGRE